MNLAALQSIPGAGGISIGHPRLINPKGNLYKIKIDHFGDNNSHEKAYEVWATKEAVQKHFNGITEDPNAYQLKKFAHQMYESRVKATGGVPKEQGVFLTTNQKVHGDPSMWPRAIIDPEMNI